jgi:hypothetical protein
VALLLRPSFVCAAWGLLCRLLLLCFLPVLLVVLPRLLARLLTVFLARLGLLVWRSLLLSVLLIACLLFAQMVVCVCAVLNTLLVPSIALCLLLL